MGEVIEAEIIQPPAPLQQNPFVVSPRPLAASVEIEVQRAVAETQAMVVVAKRCPRDVAEAKRQLEEACKDPSFAEQAFYHVPRGNDAVEGASINLADEIYRVWGNLKRVVIDHGVIQKEDGKYTQKEVVVWDVEKNNHYVQRITVKHWNWTKGGGYALDDPNRVRDVVNAVISKEMRNGILRVTLPKAYINQLKLICDATLAQAINVKDRMAKAVELFASRSIGTDKLEKLLGKTLDRVTPEDVVTLLRVWKAIEQGATLEEYFEAPATEPARRQRAPKESPAPTTTPEAAEQPAPPPVSQSTTTTTAPW